MKLHDYTITVPTECTPVSLFPFACVHLDNPGHSASHWGDFLDEFAKTKHGYGIGMGDYHDWLRTHARMFLQRYEDDEHSFKELDNYRHQETKKFSRHLDAVKDRLIGMHVGNHHHQYQDGSNDTMELCRILEAPYLEHTALTRLRFCKPDRTPFKTLTMLTLHGEGVGGGSTAGGDINAMINKGTAWDVDMVIMAHNHQKNAAATVHLTVPMRGALKLMERPRLFVRAGCFVKGYVPGCHTYAEKSLMKPTAIGHVRIDIHFHKDHGETVRHEFKVTH